MRLPGLPLAAAALLLGGCVTPLEQASWIRVETQHFELISGARKSQTLAIAERLELLRAVVERLGVETRLEPRVPLLVYVFPDAESFARFRSPVGYAGFTLPRANRTFLALQANAGADARITAAHEYVHFLLRNGNASQFPVWYDEGIAEFLSTASRQDDRIVIGLVPPGRQHWLLYGSPMSVRRMMLADDLHDWTPRAQERFYAQAWAVTHYLHVSERLGFPRRHPQLVEYLARINRGETPDDACNAAFGTDFEGLEKEFMLYLAKGELPYLGFDASKIAPPERIRTSPLPESERRYLLGELALALGDEFRDEARTWFDLALQSSPNSGRAMAALGRVTRDPAAADALLVRSQALGARDAEAQRQYAEAMLARARATHDPAAVAARVEKSRGAFRRSISLDPEQVAAYAGLGRTYLVDRSKGRIEEGLSALATANQRLPGDLGIAMARAKLEISAGEVAVARKILLRVPPPTHGDPLAAEEQTELSQVRVAAGLPAHVPHSSQHLKSRMDVELPRQGEQVRGLSSWVVARGQGGLWESPMQDVIIAIDESPSTFLPTGSDLDGDGLVGEPRTMSLLGPSHASTDPDDSVIHAELLAARALIRQLDPQTTRVGIITFAEEASVLAPLGTPKAALMWLDEYDARTYPAGTSLAAGLEGALEAFFEYREDDMRRQRTVLLLSDGHPTHPSETLGKRDALNAADELGEIGVPVQAFALGRTALEDPEFYRELAERSGGKFIPVEDPANVVSEFANIRFTGLIDVTIQSAPSGKPGRAIRVFPNGSFDGYVPLIEGENQVTITGVMESGEKVSETRTVYYERPTNPGPEDEAAAARLRQHLQDRKVEIELLAEMRRAGPPQVRRLTLEVLDPPDEEREPPPAAP